MATPVDLITAISEAVREIASLIKEAVSGADLRRLKYRVEAATNYVFVDEKAGEYSDISEKRQKELKEHFRKRIFDES